jgi:hypothetical protein
MTNDKKEKKEEGGTQKNLLAPEILVSNQNKQ